MNRSTSLAFASMSIFGIDSISKNESYGRIKEKPKKIINKKKQKKRKASRKARAITRKNRK